MVMYAARQQWPTGDFLTPDLFHSTDLANWGSSRVSIEAKFHKVSHFLGFVRYFSAKIEQSSKNHPKLALFSSNLNVFEDYSILAEK